MKKTSGNLPGYLSLSRRHCDCNFYSGCWPGGVATAPKGGWLTKRSREAHFSICKIFLFGESKIFLYQPLFPLCFVSLIYWESCHKAKGSLTGTPQGYCQTLDSLQSCHLDLGSTCIGLFYQGVHSIRWFFEGLVLVWFVIMQLCRNGIHIPL